MSDDMSDEKIIDTDEIRTAQPVAQDEEAKPIQDFQEIDPAFERMANGAEAANDSEYEQGPEQPKQAVKSLPGKSYTAADVEQAEETALNILGAAFCAVGDFTGKSYGLTEQAAIKTSKGIAPCLAKYRITDAGEAFNRWGEEIQAFLAVGALLAGVYRELKQDAANDGDKSKQQSAA